MKFFGWLLTSITGALFIAQGGITGDIYDPLWIWLEPKLGLGWGVKGVLVEMLIVFSPGLLGCVFLWLDRRRRVKEDLERARRYKPGMH